MKKIIIVVFASMLLLSACSTDTSDTAVTVNDDGTRAVTVNVLRLGEPDTATENDIVWEEIHRRFLADTGIDLTLNIEIQPWDTAHEMYVQRLAAGDRIDAGQVHTGIIRTILNSDRDALKPIDDWLPVYAPDYFSMLSDEAWRASTQFGNIVSMPQEALRAVWTVLGRTDILRDQWGLNVMPDTLEDFENLMAAIKENDPESIPLTGAYWALMMITMGIANLPENYAWASGFSMFVDDDETIKPIFFHENYPAFAEMLARWITNGWIPTEAISMNNVDADQMWFSGRSYMIANWYSLPIVNDIHVFRQTEPNAIVEYIQTPRGFDGVQRLHFNDPYEIQFVFPFTGNEDAQKAFMEYMNWSAKDPQNYRLTMYGIDGLFHTFDGNTIYPIFRDDNDNIVTDPDEIERIRERNAANHIIRYANLYAFFVTVREGYNAYLADVPENLIYTENVLSTIEITDRRLTGIVNFDYSINNIGIRNTDAENSILAMLSEILSGQRPVSDLELVKEVYMENGGREVTDELTRQYHEWLAEQ